MNKHGDYTIKTYRERPAHVATPSPRPVPKQPLELSPEPIPERIFPQEVTVRLEDRPCIVTAFNKASERAIGLVSYSYDITWHLVLITQAKVHDRGGVDFVYIFEMREGSL